MIKQILRSVNMQMRRTKQKQRPPSAAAAFGGSF
jgi:hypothetical protein